MELIIHRIIQAHQGRVTTTILYCKVKIISNLKFYWRRLHKVDPKKLEETATRGSYPLVDSSTTCKNNTHIHKEVATSQKELSQKRNIAPTDVMHISYSINGGTKLPLNCHEFRAMKPKLSGQQISRMLTKLSVYIITKTALWVPVIESPQLLKGKLTSFTSFSKVFRSDSHDSLLRPRPLERSKNIQGANQFSKHTGVKVVVQLRIPDCSTSHKLYSFGSNSPRCLAVIGRSSVSIAILRGVEMKLTPKKKGKSVMTRSIDEIVFSTEMAALDFEPNREEETFLQLIGLNRFVTRVTWEILNEQVVREVIANLNIETMETKLNGQMIPVFSKGWRQKMKAVFYLNTFLAKREPGTPRVHAADIFPNIKDKMRSKLGTCKINDCTIPEVRKPLKFFNSLFLLKTSATTISCTAVAHIQDALNEKKVNWPALFFEYIKLELISLEEGLFKDRNTGMRTLVGPPLTMLLISEGFLTVQQEIEAEILMPTELTENPASKKQKTETRMELIRGESSDHKEAPHLLVAMAEPTSAEPAMAEPCAAKLIPAPNTVTIPGVALHKTELTKILDKFTQTTQMLSNWVTQATEPKGIAVTDKDTTAISQTILQNQKMALETQLQHIQEQFKAATSKIQGLNLAAETRKKAVQEK